MEENVTVGVLNSDANANESGIPIVYSEEHYAPTTEALDNSIVESESKAQIVKGSISRSFVNVDVMSMKDDHIRILTEQNNSLGKALSIVQSDLDACRQSRFSLDKEHQILNDRNFEMASKLRFMENEMIKVKEDCSTTTDELKAIVRRNEELLRLLEAEKASNARASAELVALRDEVSNLRLKYGDLIKTGKSQEDLAKEALRDGEIRNTEIRKLREEIDLSKKENQAFKVKAALELESLEEQLRLRKEKQYHLIEKLQLQEESKREAEDRATTLKEALDEMKTKNAELETQAQLESNKKLCLEEANRVLQREMKVAIDENIALQTKANESNQDRLRIEAEARDGGEKLREMAEKVFQLLEKLKLSDFAKNAALKALKSKEQEILVLQKKASTLQKKLIDEEKARAQTQLEKTEFEEQIRSIKKHNTQLGNKCKEEAKQRAQEEEQKKEFEEKARILDSRLSFLLNKLQSDEESKIVQRDETKKMEAQLAEISKQNELHEKKAQESKESNRILSNQLLEKVEEVKSLQIKLDALTLAIEEKEKNLDEQHQLQEVMKRQDDPTRDFAGGRLRFFIQSNPATGGVIVKGKCQKDRDWIEQHGCNQMLRKALKHANVKEALLKNFAELCGTWMMQEEQTNKLMEELQEQRKKMEKIEHSNDDLQAKFCVAEENKRRILLRYITSVKASVSSEDPSSEKEQNEIGRTGAGRIHLPESDLRDEDAHAIVALIRNSLNISELNLRGNHITDEGAHVIASMMMGKTGLKFIDLRSNNISQSGIRAVAEALERSRLVKEISIHSGGKIEVFGIIEDTMETVSNQVSLQTGEQPCHKKEREKLAKQSICVIDIRENRPEALNNISFDGIEPWISSNA
jgi:hypothetical protein